MKGYGKQNREWHWWERLRKMECKHGQKKRKGKNRITHRTTKWSENVFLQQSVLLQPSPWKQLLYCVFRTWLRTCSLSFAVQGFLPQSGSILLNANTQMLCEAVSDRNVLSDVTLCVLDVCVLWIHGFPARDTTARWWRRKRWGALTTESSDLDRRPRVVKLRVWC